MFGGSPEYTNGSEAFMSFKHGDFHGVILSSFLVMFALVTDALFEQYSFKYMFVIVGYLVVTFAIMGGMVNA